MNTTMPKRERKETAEVQDRGFLSPAVNIVETTDGYMLEAEMPGVNKSGLEVLLQGTELTLVGKRDTEVHGAETVYRETSPRDFRRTFVLDPGIDTSKIQAKMENGILTLNLPKAEQLKPRRIKIAA
jgi:HSP20 family protein